MNVLLLGGGGREHTIAWKLAQSPLLSQLYIAPGNGGTSDMGTNLPFSDSDFPAMREAILEHQITLVIVGPEAPLVKGVREFIESDPELMGVGVVGPGQVGAQMEGSKSFSKAFMERHGIPTAAYNEFDSNQLQEAINYLDDVNPPYVLKADGLAAGKGVLILDDRNEAAEALRDMLEGGKFGDAGSKVVIEEFLKGIELSVFVLTDGTEYILLPEAKDYKRIGEGDTGLNTGGMGSISPVPFADDAFMKKVIDRIVDPTIQGLQQDSIQYNGFLFVGLMSVDGEPFVIEYNCRMGDPETESVIPRIKSDLLPILHSCSKGELKKLQLDIDERSAACVMLVSGGYPEAYEKGKEMHGLDGIEGSLLFHAGTTLNEGKLETNGGRVIAVTSFGESMNDALEKSYANARNIDFEGVYYRKDLGFDL
ncbi:MAG: phosphoribosylamine--glycine ligase [Flavobacteriales bacterium]|jgi:phosphoribosylamine--glycine ligase|nr:phosphoribosylamine--glycine ligase [Flavobacteriales bacterium]MBT3964636.1 phosphoribosylamine--glycine ligase [Flavobacteriales bacterium]MBT4704406.1 phosphoribosylamine--glycine ligase [Flavobacteriales bacterium]MBT4929483.1 phosphoribosylamine--glycine ligase [Flavobacteriales bacterium]MBT5131939.1 phosphoribosylamine--glycine ligase [Flavobacteriales bacterium]